MKLVVDIPEKTLERVRNIVQSEKYESPSEFVKTALENQVELETSELGQKNIQSIDEFILGGGSNLSQEIPTQYNSPDELEIRNYKEISLLNPPERNRIENGPLWGQYNRILPIKIAVRRLANSLLEAKSDRLPHKDFHGDVAPIAREIGLQLQAVDSEMGRGRGEKLASALPVGDDPHKSMKRYKEQFVGRMDNRGHLSGACPALQFVDITAEGNIGITEVGIQFAKLDNPLLDQSLREDNSLSELEQEFYLDHVVNSLPRELEAMKRVADRILAGEDRPDTMTDEIAQMNGDWTRAQADTVRTGLVGRMYELGLLTRKSVGQRGVSYQLTEFGDDFFKKQVGISV